MEKNKKMMTVIIILLVILLVVVGVVAFLGYNAVKGVEPPEAKEPMTVQPLTSVVDSETVSFTTPLNVNLLKENKNAAEWALSINISLEIDASNPENDKLVAKIKSSEQIIRDVVITTLREKTYLEVEGPDATAILKQEILTLVQEKFKTNIIYAVNIGDYFLVKVQEGTR